MSGNWARLLKVRAWAGLNLRGEIVVGIEGPTGRVVSFLPVDGAEALYASLGDALHRARERLRRAGYGEGSRDA